MQTTDIPTQPELGTAAARTPGRTVSVMPPDAKPTVGVPQAIDSMTVWPNDSCGEGMT